MKKDNPVIIFGAFETALGIARSLGVQGINSDCLDFKKDICFYSKYCKGYLVPHPISESEKLIEYLNEFVKKFSSKPVIFITSDDFLRFVLEKIDFIKDKFLINISDKDIVEEISDKYRLYLKCLEIGIEVPRTFYIRSIESLNDIINGNNLYPLFLKGKDVNSWRKMVHGSLKGFVVNNADEFYEKGIELIEKGVEFIAQEVIKGRDCNHFKCCVYINNDGEEILNFTLRKLLQNPIHFGVGAIVESIADEELQETGRKLFKGLNFRGVGSAEFKRDEKDEKLKLIEINPRYWQQNYLSTRCGMNFPLINYLDLTDQQTIKSGKFETGIKWVNRYMSFNSFIDYRKKKEITYREWRKLSKGKRVTPDFSIIDPLPALYEIGFGKKIFNIPKFLIKKVLN